MKGTFVQIGAEMEEAARAAGAALCARFGVRHDIKGSPPIGPASVPASGNKIG